MCLKARDFFKKAGLSKMTNTKVIKYGKITSNVAYEIVETKSWANEETKEHLCILSFVTEKNDKYIYDTDKCISASLQELLVYITKCKKEEKILKWEEK